MLACVRVLHFSSKSRIISLAVRLRCFQSLRLIKQLPELALVPSERISKPANDDTLSTPSSSLAIFRKACAAAFVRSIVEPGGVSTTA